ncbi:MAG: bacillithiol biosynthesis BshC, partial [Moheibacter sp.]
TQQNKRERIVRENNLFKVLNSDIQFTQKELQKALHETPENFSPNVILRPLFQETILPNIAYIGGGGEIAYWLQLKSFFESQNVAFPALIVRNSILLLSDKQHKKLEKLDILYEDLFLPLHKLVRKNIKQNSTVSIDFNDYKTRLTQLFDELEQKAEQTDVSFINMVNAQRTKQTKGLEKMKNRFVKAEKKVQSERVHRVETLYSEIFPHGNLQERLTNFSELWIEYGSSFIDEIYTEIKPIDFHFGIKTLR